MSNVIVPSDDFAIIPPKHSIGFESSCDSVKSTRADFTESASFGFVEMITFVVPKVSIACFTSNFKKAGSVFEERQFV